MKIDLYTMEKRTPIYLRQALEIMNTRQPDNNFVPFDLTIRTFNSQNGKGGKWIFYENARLLPEKNHDKKKTETLDTILLDEKASKRPNHYQNRTRNIELSDGSVKTIRIDFIITINSHPVIY